MDRTDKSPVAKRELRRFGMVTGAMVTLPFGLLLPWWSGGPIPIWPFAVGGGLWIAAVILPAALSPVRAGWVALGNMLGWVNTRVLLGLIFYVIILPSGLALRLMGKDPMARGFDAHAATYRVLRKAPGRNHMERPY